MTLMSMTGFGRGEAQTGGVRVEVEVSSVNRKQLDVQPNLPRALQALEVRVVDAVSRCMSRGRVQVQVAVKAASGAERPVHVNLELAAACLKQLRLAAARLGVADDLALHDVMRIPGVLEIRDAGNDSALIEPLLDKALARALRALTAMRRREGLSLMVDLGARIDALENRVRRIAVRAPGLTGRYRDALRARITRLAEGMAVDHERLEKEVVLFADRIDITEELTRLSSHIQQARSMLKQKEPAGRALDFLAQEILREINTIASKAGDAVISASVVQLKAELERFREQVQNIE